MTSSTRAKDANAASTAVTVPGVAGPATAMVTTVDMDGRVSE